MKVSATKLDTKILGVNKFDKVNRSALRKQSFAGTVDQAAKVGISTIAKNDLSKFAQLCLGAEKIKGEVINALITAFGTACVAPFFIAFNPISKEDKNTKKYSAWRQPISAAIAFIATFAAVAPYDRYIVKQASEGNWQGADLRAKPESSYVKKIIKKQHPEYTMAELNEAVEKFRINAFNKIVDETKEKVKNKKLTITDADLLGAEKYEEILKEVKKENPKLSKDALHDLTHTRGLEKVRKEVTENANTIFDIISKGKYSTIEEASKAITAQVNEFEPTIKLNTGLSLVKARLEELVKKDTPLSKIISDKKIVRILSEVDATTKSAIENILNGKATEGKEIVEALENKIKSMKADINKAKILDDLISRMESLPAKTSFAEFKKSLGNSLNEVTHNVRIRQYVQAYTENAQRSFTRSKMWLGVVVAFVVQPISCIVLNYAYPRIMEFIMPEMAQKKKEQYQKIIASNQQNRRKEVNV